jgi:ribosomal protein S12 methylthiotransferase accessory factor
VKGPGQRLQRAVGVSRLATVTSMDRAGVEVVAAVRPTGHVLQVSQGKGLTLDAARWSALGEAAELHAAEHPDVGRLVFSEGTELEGAVLDDDGLARAWVQGHRLSDGLPVWVAAERVFCVPFGRAWLGPSTLSWSSNGLGAHPRRASAVRHAVLEVWERHALAQALPFGWTRELIASTAVRCDTRLVRQLEARHFEVVTCLLQRRPLPVAGALVFDAERGPVPLTAGYACRLSAHDALQAAVLEAAQSRLTEIHGAREDVAVGAREPGLSLSGVGSTARPEPTVAVKQLPPAVLRQMVLVALQSRPLHVVKAIGIGLVESELLR